jgi:hypothetical protein
MEEKIMDKIRKVLALTNSPNEHEAALAAQMAQELLARYNIDISQVREKDENGKKSKIAHDTNYKSSSKPQWRALRDICAQMYFCKYYYIKTFGNQEYSCYIGEPHNIEVAKLMSEYLIEAVKRLAKEGRKNYPMKERANYWHSFTTAASHRLYWRIKARIDETRKKATVASDGRNLPALNDLYESARQRHEEFMAQIGIRLKTTRGQTGGSHTGGLIEGRAAGDRISIDPQIRGGGSSGLLN